MALSLKLLPFALALCLGGCTKADPERIVGRWKAERFKVYSLNVPLAPEIEFKDNKLILPESDAIIDVASLSANGDEVVVNFPTGLGLSFYFESKDIMYVDLPFVEKIYYHRQPDINKVSASERQDQTTKTSPAPNLSSDIKRPLVNKDLLNDPIQQAIARMNVNDMSTAQEFLNQAVQSESKRPHAEFYLAVIKLRQGDTDGALGTLSNAFSHGFNDFKLLDANSDFHQLKGDVRFKALVARYRS